MKNLPFAFFLLALGLFLFSNNIGAKEDNLGNSASRESQSPYLKELLEIHNNNRKSKGVEALDLDAGLCEYAQKHSDKMAKKDSLYHSSMSELQKFCGADVVGENIAWGQETSESVVSSWMWSPMHRWNILGGSYKKVGFGVSEDAQGRKYWCVVFSS